MTQHQGRPAGGNSDALAEAAGGCLGELFGFLVAVVVRSLVLASMWGWYVVPLGAPPIGAAHAMMLSFLVNIVVVRPQKREGEKHDWTAHVLISGLVWLIGWAVHCWGM